MTTFAELQGWGLSPETLEQILGHPLPKDQGATLKDFFTAKGLDFETIKLALQAAVDQMP